MESAVNPVYVRENIIQLDNVLLLLSLFLLTE
jgi:hypothetical protein